jgi:hypothetical protein
MKYTLTLLAAFIIIASTCTFSQIRITPYDTKDHVGDTVTVVGKIYKVRSNSEGVYSMNLGSYYNENEFTAIIYPEDVDAFDYIRDNEGMLAEITGIVNKDEDDHPIMILTSQDQIIARIPASPTNIPISPIRGPFIPHPIPR